MARRVPDLPDRYAHALADHLVERDARTLLAAEELGRQALLEGRGILDVAHAHHLMLAGLGDGLELSSDDLEAAGAFLASCLAPFARAHRRALDAVAALGHHDAHQQDELRRIARTLREELAPRLGEAHAALAAVAGAAAPALRPELERVAGLLTQVEAGLRGLSRGSEPLVLDEQGLPAALEQLVEQVATRHDLEIDLTHHLHGRLPRAVEVALYRTVEQALDNVVRHARARRVSVRLERGPDGVVCLVRDDGVGLRSERGLPAEGIGIAELRERLTALGGALEVESAPHRGTTLRAAVRLDGIAG
jgi:signal transduction histidine kinase